LDGAISEDFAFDFFSKIFNLEAISIFGTSFRIQQSEEKSNTKIPTPTMPRAPSPSMVEATVDSLTTLDGGRQLFTVALHGGGDGE